MRESTEHLILQFCESSKKHFAATMAGDFRSANKEVDKIQSLYLKIKAQGAEARELLISVALQGENPEAVFAATYSLTHDPDRSMKALKRLSKSPGFLGFQARESMKRWEREEGDLD